jgi:hypothetical protein
LGKGSHGAVSESVIVTENIARRCPNCGAAYCGDALFHTATKIGQHVEADQRTPPWDVGEECVRRIAVMYAASPLPLAEVFEQVAGPTTGLSRVALVEVIAWLSSQVVACQRDRSAATIGQFRRILREYDERNQGRNALATD